jgi:hypothetical protein
MVRLGWIALTKSMASTSFNQEPWAGTNNVSIA